MGVQTSKRNLIDVECQIVYFWSIIGTLVNLYAIFIGRYTILRQLGLSLLFTVSLAFLCYKPKKAICTVTGDRIPWYDWLLAVLSLIPNIYVILQCDVLINRVARPTTLDITMSALLIVLILEGCRRVMGYILPFIAILFIAYCFLGKYVPGIFRYRGTSLARFLSLQYMTTEGIFSSPTQICAKMIFIFTLFGAFLIIAGGGDKLMNIAISFTGKYSGGPAKVAVVSSGLMGMVSGSASANVATTGQFTIPMMKNLGFPSEIAGAIEAVASTGGTLAPPIMGAGAFIMAETLGVRYLDIVKAAIIPAILYYFCEFLIVHFEAKKLGLSGMSIEKLPSKRYALFSGLIVILPLILLIALVSQFFPVMKSALYATIVVILISQFDRDNRITVKKFFNALANAMRSMITLSLCCTAAGIVVGCISLTGLGVKFASTLMSFSQGYSFLALILGMIIVVILGMGLPATAAYVVSSAIVGSSLIRMGFPALPTQMFIFYYSCLAQITPPIALASFVAASIAECNPLKCAQHSVRLGIIALIIPFMFINNITLLGMGNSLSIVQDFIAAMLGVTLCAIGLAGYLKSGLNLKYRIVFIFSGMLLLMPGLRTDIIGIIIAWLTWISTPLQVLVVLVSMTFIHNANLRLNILEIKRVGDVKYV